MEEELLLVVSPFVFVLMSIYMLFELIRINKILNLWQINSLMVIPILTIVTYLYIVAFEPSIEIARIAVRVLISLSLTIGTHVLYSYSRLLRKGGKP